jgi:thiosulfate dehydrogenase [quinone] large subunit
MPEKGTAMTYPNTLAPGRGARVLTVLMRVTVAYLWFENLGWKVPPYFGADDRSGLWGFTNGAIQYPVFAPFSTIVEKVIIPNFGPFGWMVYFAEISLAVFLFLGLATRLWALVGVAQSFVIYLTVGAQPNEWPWTYVLMMVAHLALFTLAAGRVAGVDAVLRRRAKADPGRAMGWLLRAT